MKQLTRVTAFWLVAMVHGIRYAIGWVATRRVQDPEERRRAVARLRGRTLRAAMERLGATFIKLGQVLSTRPDLVDAEVIAELRHLQDGLPAFPFVEVCRTLRAELGHAAVRVAEIEARPLAAASVAQVHRARLTDGSEVAIKVLRPDVREKVRRDAEILLGAARILSVFPAARHSDLEGHLAHFVKGILDQTDLRIEAEHYDRFRTNFAAFDGVIFPHVHRELSATRVLTMELLRGTKVDELPPGDHSLLSLRLRRVVLKMLFEDGFVHADLHPGNFLITDDGSVAIFDVGLSKGLSEDVLVQYIDWNRCLVMGTTEDYVRHLRAYYIRADENVDWDALTRDVDAFTTSFRGKSMKELETADIAQSAFAIGRKYGLRPVSEMALIIVAMVTAEGVGKMLSPEVDTMSEIREYLIPILARRGMLG
ncbi:MAG: AarF/ABC1/UbiB kinase family protein [Deltaproteobacteria bacterium]|nr:AarF/ABC1/UbiB kinase family protein [Deltaproteobacteria bacterium]